MFPNVYTVQTCAIGAGQRTHKGKLALTRNPGEGAESRFVRDPRKIRIKSRKICYWTDKERNKEII